MRLLRIPAPPKPAQPEPEDAWCRYAVVVKGFGAGVAPGRFTRGEFFPLDHPAVIRFPEHFRRVVPLEEVR